MQSIVLDFKLSGFWSTKRKVAHWQTTVFENCWLDDACKTLEKVRGHWKFPPDVTLEVQMRMVPGGPLVDVPMAEVLLDLFTRLKSGASVPYPDWKQHPMPTLKLIIQTDQQRVKASQTKARSCVSHSETALSKAETAAWQLTAKDALIRSCQATRRLGRST